MTNLLTLADVALSGDKPTYTPYGYIIGEDGTIHSLTKQSAHGLVIALLYPEFALKAGYEAPNRDPDVFHYQRFQLDDADALPVVSVSRYLTGVFNVSKGDKVISSKQRESLVKIFATEGVKMHDTINTDRGDMRASKAIEWLTTFDRDEENERIKDYTLVVPDEDKKDIFS
jgi:hypothetical protein